MSNKEYKLTHQILSQLPDKFEWKEYLKLNPDLEKLGFTKEYHSVLHYLKYGKYENRPYLSSQQASKKEYIKPEDFDWNIYLALNPDLKQAGIVSETEAIIHFLTFGKSENRAYKVSIEDRLPAEFDPKLYRLYNPDLSSMSEDQLIEHFLKHGKKELRSYYAGISYEDLISQKETSDKPHYINKNSILLINHHVSLTGAPIYLYDLYDYIVENNIFKNVYIVEPYPNNVLPKHPTKLYHFNEINRLSSIFEKTSPLLIYSNSMNFYLFNYNKFPYWHHRSLIHLHEVYKDFSQPFINTEIFKEIAETPVYVVSEKIKKEFVKNIPALEKSIKICPPFIPIAKQSKIQEKAKQKAEILINDVTKNKTLIGMCGDISIRKNPILLIKLAQQNPQHNFLWIGGKDLEATINNLYPNEDTTIPDNFYWIPHTDNPYKYIAKIDYFFLTSLSDPCPIVVLESLLLNKKVIVINNNIHTNHITAELEDYIVVDGKNNDEICNSFKQLDISKTSNTTTKNTEYIQRHYSVPRILTRQSKQYRRDFLILSLYVDSINQIELDYYVNLINQFSIRHQEVTQFTPIVTINTDNSIFKENVEHYLNRNIKYLDESGIVITRPNSGYDIGGLLDGLKYIHDEAMGSIDVSTRVAYLHNKNNESWKNILHSIFYLNTDQILSFNAISPRRFTVTCEQNDLNRNIFKQYPKIFDDKNLKQDFLYTQGTTFITKIQPLMKLVKKYDMIEPLLTSITKDDIYWQECMKNNRIFNQYVAAYAKQAFNKPIDKDSKTMVEKGLCKNFMQLYRHYQLRGIPDLQFEHALERYIGFLIFKNQKL